MDIKGVLVQWLIDFLIKNFRWCHYANESGVKKENISNKELAGELHEPLIRKLKK